MAPEDFIKIDYVAYGCGVLWNSSDNELIAMVAEHAGELPDVPGAEDDLLLSLKELRCDLDEKRRFELGI